MASRVVGGILVWRLAEAGGVRVSLLSAHWFRSSRRQPFDAYKHTFSQTCTYTHTQFTYMSIHMHTCTHTYTHACMHACWQTDPDPDPDPDRLAHARAQSMCVCFFPRSSVIRDLVRRRAISQPASRPTSTSPGAAVPCCLFIAQGKLRDAFLSPSSVTKREPTRHRRASSSFRAAQNLKTGPFNPILRACPFPDVAGPVC